MNNLTSLHWRKLLYPRRNRAAAHPHHVDGDAGRAGAHAGNSGARGACWRRKRDKFKYGEHDLGNVDPASSTMNLLLPRFSGNRHQRFVERCHRISALAERLGCALRSTTEVESSCLQPHFLKVWHFQGWNLAYNVSAEWDGVADRYYWVKEGIKFFKKGPRSERAVCRAVLVRGGHDGQKGWP